MLGCNGVNVLIDVFHVPIHTFKQVIKISCDQPFVCIDINVLIDLQLSNTIDCIINTFSRKEFISFKEI